MDGKLVENSFLATYLVLYGTALITFIESLRTPNARVRHILNLETAVSLVAGFVYGMFMDQIKSGKLELDQITPLRYIDWCITTPMLLLVLLLFFNFHNPKSLSFSFYTAIVLVNWMMLAAGYLAETNKISKLAGFSYGFGFFGIMIAMIWFHLLHDVTDMVHLQMVFFAFVVIWALYGIVFLLDTTSKNIAYNVLDMVAKVFFGLFMWLYYGGVVAL